MRWVRWLACVAILLGAGRAVADDPAGSKRPWADGVSAEQQAESTRLLQLGNSFFEKKQYQQALATYRQAIAAWDHPAIRFNIAVARIELDQPLAAYEDLVRALRYGAAPLHPEAYAEALRYQKLLLGQLAQLKVVCREPGAQVLLDGEEIMIGPGEMTRVLLPGKHQLVATKAVYVTATRALSLVAGQSTSEEIRLAPVAGPIVTERRWPVWAPWAIVGAGAGLALAGVPFRLAAGAAYDDYDRQVTAMCPARGCDIGTLPQSVRDVKSRAQLENGVAVGLFAAGAAVAAGGIVLVLLNQPHAVVEHVSVVPSAGGLAVAGVF